MADADEPVSVDEEVGADYIDALTGLAEPTQSLMF